VKLVYNAVFTGRRCDGKLYLPSLDVSFSIGICLAHTSRHRFTPMAAF
jgi:hypothetical protein